MNKLISWVSIFFLRAFFIEVFVLCFLMPVAQAGGFEQSATNKPVRSIAATPKWETWGASYWSNGNICREKNANLICLIPQQAQENHWSFPSKNKSQVRN